MKKKIFFKPKIVFRLFWKNSDYISFKLPFLKTSFNKIIWKKNFLESLQMNTLSKEFLFIKVINSCGCSKQLAWANNSRKKRKFFICHFIIPKEDSTTFQPFQSKSKWNCGDPFHSDFRSHCCQRYQWNSSQKVVWQ